MGEIMNVRKYVENSMQDEITPENR